MNDTADSRSIAVLRTRLPYTDRRSLSQAWFSALHFAEEGRRAVLPARRSCDPASRTADVRTSAAHRATNRAAAVATALRGSAAARTVREPDVIPAQRVRDPVKRANSAAFERARSYPPFRTTLTIGVEGARITLLVRRQGPTLHVVALCSERNAGIVRRALACADAHLRRSGESIHASLQTPGTVRP